MAKLDATQDLHRKGNWHLQAAAIAEIPQPYCLVKAPRDQHVGGGIESAAEDKVGVSLKSAQALPGGTVPDLEGFVI
jgi:hypothetical protein